MTWNTVLSSRHYGTILEIVGREGVSLYTEVSSFQGVGIEEFHCIQQRCHHFRVLEWRSSTIYRGVLISGGWNRGVPLYTTEVSPFQGVGIEEFHYIQRCPHFRGLE